MKSLYKVKEEQIYTDSLEVILTAMASYMLDKRCLKSETVITYCKSICELADSIRQDYVSLNDLKEVLESEYKLRITRKMNKGILFENMEDKDAED